ncbi:MAG: hypothetical protein EBV84_11295 [Betaproteobacteria bacterium]|jgi:hypothetical protein|nr:hypothetical protein [Betaproteobacteria bacterium]
MRPRALIARALTYPANPNAGHAFADRLSGSRLFLPLSQCVIIDTMHEGGLGPRDSHAPRAQRLLPFTRVHEPCLDFFVD